MMKHGHAKRVINSCSNYVSPFYRYARYRHRHVTERERERERKDHFSERNSPGSIHAIRATRVFNKFFR